MTASRYDPDLHGDYLDVDECAECMAMSVVEIRQLVERRVLKAIRLGAGVVLVQPAITNHH
jgi:hypothetical protein